MKKQLFLFVLAVSNVGAMAQAFGWAELGSGSNALNANSRIQSICADAAGEVYTATFVTNDTINYNYYVSRWNGVKWSKLGNNSFYASNGYGSNGSVICTDGFNIYAASSISNALEAKDYVAEFSLVSWERFPNLEGLNGIVQIYTICTDILGNLYAGGNIWDDSANRCVAKWDAAALTWINLPMPKDLLGMSGFGWQIYGLCTGGLGVVYAAGTVMDSIGAQVIKYDGTHWSELGTLNANGWIYTLCTDPLGNVYAAGQFTNTSGKYYVAEWDGFKWSELGGNNALNANGTILSICTDAFGNVYAAGCFVDSSGYYVAKWDGMGWSELGSGNNPLNANGCIRSICTDATGNGYAAGDFTDSAGFYYVAKCAKIDQVKWIRLNSNTSAKLKAVHFPHSNSDYNAGQSENIGYAAGEGGTILKTIDGGTNWTSQSSGTSNSLYSIYFSDTNIGFVVGASGTIIKTTNGGTNWAALNSGTNTQLNSICFTDTATGYAVGAGGTILKTTNGGTNWTALNSGTLGSLYSIYFPNANDGYAVGESGTIIKTSDGGANWLAQASGTINLLHSVKFLDASMGFAVGDSGTILKTTDGGVAWTAHNVPVSQFLYSVYFTDADTGYAAGANGAILKTTNGGTIWAVQNSGTSNNLSSVYFTDPNAGYAVGDSGTIVGTITGATGIRNTQSLKSNTLKIYPNPSYDKITIETFETPVKGQLSIMNLNGVELLRQQTTAPKSLVDVYSLQSGVYFVKFSNERTVQVGKFIKY